RGQRAGAGGDVVREIHVGKIGRAAGSERKRALGEIEEARVVGAGIDMRAGETEPFRSGHRTVEEEAAAALVVGTAAGGVGRAALVADGVGRRARPGGVLRA